MKNTVNILVDANNFWNRTLFSANFKSNKERLFNEGDRGIYMRKLATDFASFLRRFKGYYSSVVVCVDSKSWRKIEADFAEVGYKANRKKKEEINWQVYNEINDEFIEIIQSVGINVSKADSTEADDLIRGYVDYFKDRGENTVVWSADNDLMQLVYHNEESFNIQYYQPPMQKNSITATEEFFTWLNSTTNGLDNALSAEDILFNLAEMSKDDFNVTLRSIFDKNGLGQKVVDPLEIVFKKIIGGDSSDGIAKIKSGIGKVALENAWTHYKGKFSVDECLTEVYQMGIIDTLVRMDKIKEQKDVDLATRLLGLNVRLIVLDERTAPEYVNANIQNEIENQSFTRINNEQIEDMRKLLDGTEHFDSKRTNALVPKGMDPFAGIDEAKDKKTKSLF